MKTTLLTAVVFLGLITTATAGYVCKNNGKVIISDTPCGAVTVEDVDTAPPAIVPMEHPAVMACVEHWRSSLKNPDSVIPRRAALGSAVVVINVQAQNGFGGPGRDFIWCALTADGQRVNGSATKHALTSINMAMWEHVLGLSRR